MSDQKKTGKIVVNRDLCIGASSCLISAGDVFELDGENKAIIKVSSGKEGVSEAQKSELESTTITDEALLEAAQSCPTKAIILFDEDGEQIYP